MEVQRIDYGKWINLKLTEETIMRFDEELEQFVFECHGLIFAWDEEPVEDYIEQVKTISEKYHARLDSIIEFMMPDIVAIFGDFSANEIKEKLGKPVINYDNGQVNYLHRIKNRYLRAFPEDFVEHCLSYNGGISAKPFFYFEEEDIETEVYVFSIKTSLL